MIARVLTAFTTAIVLATPALAQQPASTSQGAVGTTGTKPAAPAATPATPPVTTAGLVAAPAAARAADAVTVDPRDYRIGPEDVLDINVWKNEELSRERIPVRPDGKISHPLINDINVAGLTTNQVKAELTARFSQFIENPEVSIVVREIHSPKVSVLGNVRMPGYFELKTPDVKVLDIIARAQGFNEFADKGNIKVIRRGPNGTETAIDFKYNDAVNGRNGANFVVQAGDVVFVN
ncbi:MAG TPA: polysaccharide biosynthesis/export family protein [Vicinamibacterales bacterium]|jgi:polysaccharide export outer membrane protein|nr:polysaccharide biosynthesis/export family protein [Vicinamibacterales bacterium]